MSVIALTRPVPSTISQCELTHLEREPISYERAVSQHEAYETALGAMLCDVRRIAGADDHPDSVFIEDTAIVLDECAVITRPGADSRRGETGVVEAALREFRTLLHVTEPDTLDGGDVLRVDKRLWVGLSLRSTPGAVKQLGELLKPFGYRVDPAPVRDCLHLKTAVSALPDGRILINPKMTEVSGIKAKDRIEVDPTEPFGGNVLFVGEALLCPESAPRTRDRLERAGFATMTVDASELAKAEGGLTCCSLLIGA